MMIPTVHLNGTSREELMQQIRDAYDALFSALEKLRAMTPHGRDYYVQGPESGQKARDEHEVRIKMVLYVVNELLIMAAEIDKQ